MTALEQSDTLTRLEREYLAAIGWTARTRPTPIDPDLIHNPARRHIAETIARQTAEHGATSWTAIYDTLTHQASQGDTTARDALEEIPHVPTADGLPAMIPALVDRLQAAANRRRRWAHAVQTIEELSGGRAHVVQD